MAHRDPDPHPGTRKLLNQCELYFSVVQRRVVTTNDFYGLADIGARLRAFEDRYNFAARPFDWLYTTKDLNELLDRLTPTTPAATSRGIARRTSSQDHED